MTAYDVIDLVAAVRTVLDEIGVNDAAFLLPGDTAHLDGIIASRLADAARSVHMAASRRMLQDAPALTATERAALTLSFTKMTDGMYRVTLPAPAGLMRLVTLRMSDWALPAVTFCQEGTVDYVRQQDIYACGTWQDPVVALCGDTLELYSCRSGEAGLDALQYLPYPAVRSDGTLPLCERLHSACIYWAAGLALTSFKDQHAADMFNISKTMMA